MTIRRIGWSLVVALGILVGLGRAVSAQVPAFSGPPILQPPASGLTLPYTIGTATVGAMQQIIPAGSVVVVDNQNACNPPQFAACNIIYWPGSGTVLLVTSLPATAFLAGNMPVAYVTTFGGIITAAITSTQTIQGPDGVTVLTGAVGVVGLRLPLCNAFVKQTCQVSTGSLSGY